MEGIVEAAKNLDGGQLFTALEKLKVPILEEQLGLDEPTQSIVGETLFWMVSYMLFAQIFSRVVRVLLRSHHGWKQAAFRSGIFAANAQDDLVILMTLGVHHTFGGMLMFFGALHNNPNLWRHGMLVEVGFEVSDFVSTLLRTFPYTQNLKPEIKATILLHHIPALSMAIPVLKNNLHESPHLQEIGASLLLAGGVACFCGSFIHLRDLKTQMLEAAVAQVANLLFFLFCRFWIFPFASIKFYNEIVEAGTYSSFTVNGVLAGNILLGVFNVGIAIDVIPKTIRYVQKVVDPKVEIETVPVPPSLDQVAEAASKEKKMD